MEAAIITVAAKVFGPIVLPIGRYVVRPIARRCPFKNLWEYKSNLENLKTKLKELEAKRVSVQGLTHAGVDPLPDVNDWLHKATNIIDEVSGVICEDDRQRQKTGCCEGCTDFHLKEWYQHRNNVARKLKDVAALLQEAMKSRSLWEYKSNLENLKKEVEKLVARRETVQHLIKDGEEPLPHVKVWQESVDCMINEVSLLIDENNPEHQNDVARKLIDVTQLLREAREFREVSTISEETVYKNNLENLKKNVEKLEARRESVQRLINVGEEPLPHVKLWQGKVNSIVNEVSGLTSQHNPEQQNNVARYLNEVAQLLQEGAQFKEVSYEPVPEQTSLQLSIQREASESRLSILKDIVAALRNADVNMVGIYGMGGVGKTTLAKKVGNQAMQDQLFDKTVFVEVSQSPDIRTIQGVIADYLGLKFEEETVPGRARKLCDVLKKDKRILIILDNLWKEGIKLEKVGIPFGNDCKGLKLLLTARSRDVLTRGMDSHPNFHVKALSGEDAWILFKSIAGTCVDHPHLKSTAFEVAKKCGGMPLAIATLAKALKDTETKEEWEDALRRLNNPSSESFEGITEEVYNSIKLSYNCLPGKLKEIFLLCSRMGHTYDASVRDLFIYGLGLGFFEDFDMVEDALCNVHASVNQLKAASLLLDAPETEMFFGFRISTPVYERFAIHDVICDVARSIASKDQHVFTVLDDHVPRSLTNENTLKKCTSITLYSIGELPKDLKMECPNLKFLYVRPNDSCFKIYSGRNFTISDNFFMGMLNLQVLHLIETDLNPLPTSLADLANLQALYLEQCDLGDIVAIGAMKKLEILSFLGSDIKELPKEMCQLTNLRLLDLTQCDRLRVIPLEVIPSLTRIEALYMYDVLIPSQAHIERSDVSIDELKHLRRLNILEMRFPNAKLCGGLIFSKLKRYKIVIGYNEAWVDDWKAHSNISRMLRLNLDTEGEEDWIMSQLPGVEQLELTGEVVGAIHLLDDLDRNGFPQLKHLQVSYNSQCVCIVNSVSCAVLPSLESLMIDSMERLKKICNSPFGADSLLHLNTINVSNCEKLSNIFRLSSIVRVLPNLTDLEVSFCQNMEEIFAIEEQDDGNNTEMVDDIKFSQLSYLKLEYLSKLKSFCCRAKTASSLQLATGTSANEIFSANELNNPSSLFNEKVVIPNLQKLEVHGIHHVEQIWHSLLPTMSSCIQNLTYLEVSNCHNFKELFSSSMTIAKESREKEKRDTILFPKLNWLEICNLTKLTRLCSGYYIEFPLLEVFIIRSCRHLEEFIFNETVKVPNLKEIRICRMANLKMIWHNKLDGYSFSKLKSLLVAECMKLVTVFPSNMCRRLLSLGSLNVCCCDSLEQICDLGINSEEYDSDSILMNLQVLEVSGCQSLKYFFVASNVAKEGVVPKEVPVNFVFPNLTRLELCHLPELKTFYPSKHTVELPILKRLELCDCGHYDTDEEGQMQQLLFYLVQQVFPCLEELTLHGKELTMMWQAQVPKCFFNKLKILHVLKDESTVCPLGSIQRFQNLEKLLLTGYKYRDMFYYDEYQTQAGPLAKMKTLVLRCLDDLKYMWEQDSQLDLIFQNFQILTISACHSLINLMLPSASFQNITMLKVYKCSSLETTVTSSMAKSLVKLETMDISHCRKVTEVIENRGNVTEERIIFSNLKTLRLEQVDNLTSFCSCTFTLEFPSLEELDISYCPNMETFSRGDLTMPGLLNIMIDLNPFRLCTDNNLNTIIQQSHEERKNQRR